MSKTTKAQRDELRRLHAEARDPMATARDRAQAERMLSDRMVWTGDADPMGGDLPALLDDLDAAEAERDKCCDDYQREAALAVAAEAERDEAVALIDAAKSDVRPESFLEHAQAILAKCIAPYSCEQMKAVGDALAGCYRKWELMSEVALKAREDADAMAKCKGCGGTVGDHLAPDQGGCPGSFEIDGVQMVPLSGRDYAVAERDDAKAKLAALVEAAENSDIADNHVGTCEYMEPYRGCRCGREELLAAIAAARGGAS